MRSPARWIDLLFGTLYVPPGQATRNRPFRPAPGRRVAGRGWGLPTTRTRHPPPATRLN